MFTELRAGLILLASLAFLLIIISIFPLGMVMMPNRWSDRTRLGGEGRSTEQTGSRSLTSARDRDHKSHGRQPNELWL